MAEQLGTSPEPETLPPEALVRRIAPEICGCTRTDEIRQPLSTVGQERAHEALAIGLAIGRVDYSIFVASEPGLGEREMVAEILKARAAELPPPPDWCYVHDFDAPRRPRAIAMPAGRGRVFRAQMADLVEELALAVPQVLDGETMRARRLDITQRCRREQDEALTQLQRAAEGAGLTLVRQPAGLAIRPLIDTEEGRVQVDPGELGRYADAVRAEALDRVQRFEGRVQETLRRNRAAERASREEVREIARRALDEVAEALLAEVAQRFDDQPRIQRFLQLVRQDLATHVAVLLGDSALAQDGTEAALREAGDQPRSAAAVFARYQVNLLVDNGDLTGAPVVWEDRPTVPALIGQIDPPRRNGLPATDPALIKAGALHRANGGFLVLDAGRLLREPQAWDELKRVLTARGLAIRSEGVTANGQNPAQVLDPEPIALVLQVILIGTPACYREQGIADPDFLGLFRIMAEMVGDIRCPDARLPDYARWLAGIARQEHLRPLTAEAVAAVAETAIRLSGHAGRISVERRRLAELLVEADHRAGAEDAIAIEQEHVLATRAAQERRQDRLRERMYEQIEDGVVLISTEGAETGVVNGLAVHTVGRFGFGKPYRISASVRQGRGAVVDIEREVALGGALHSKGVLILQGLIGNRFGRRLPMAFAASLVFEQSYDRIDGDSASSTEYYALVSALSGIAIRQCFAVTGSVNQLGEIQAIGGVNEKIEGFFDICRQRGLTGRQGVLIPRANRNHLMLRSDVVAAVSEGQFRIFPTDHVDEGVEILTGVPAGKMDLRGDYPAGTVNHWVMRRLEAFSTMAQWAVLEAQRTAGALAGGEEP